MSTKINKNKVILITGCSSGLGMSTARLLLKKGYVVIPTVRNKSDLKSLPNAVLLDVTWSQTKINLKIQSIVQKFNKIDCVINNAGFGYHGRISESKESEVRKLFETNFMGTYKVIMSVLPYMKLRREGLILNVSSVLSTAPLPDYGIYSSSKAAVESLSRVLRVELYKDNIKVVVINPGTFKTDINKKSIYTDANNYNESKNGSDPIIFSQLINKVIKTKNPRDQYFIGQGCWKTQLIKLLPKPILMPLISKYLR